jgi:hypothetical protein
MRLPNLKTCFSIAQDEAAGEETQAEAHGLIKLLHIQPGSKGQSFLELAVILPVLLIIAVGMTEVAFFTGRYLDMLDLTREAARFASLRDPFPPAGYVGDYDCSTQNFFDFYYDTACVFSPPYSASCPDATFCNGFNPFIPLDMARDDVVIEAFTLIQASDGTHIAERAFPEPDGYWALSDHDTNAAHGNWKKDCLGHNIRTAPYFTLARINSYLLQDSNTPSSKGYVAVEFYYCYHQVLNLPIVANLIPNPMRINAYTLMSLPAAAPTATPIP